MVGEGAARSLQLIGDKVITTADNKNTFGEHFMGNCQFCNFPLAIPVKVDGKRITKSEKW